MQQQLVEEVFGAHVFNEILEFINDLIFVILFYGHVLANNLANELQQVIRYEDGAIYSQSQRNGIGGPSGYRLHFPPRHKMNFGVIGFVLHFGNDDFFNIASKVFNDCDAKVVR